MTDQEIKALLAPHVRGLLALGAARARPAGPAPEPATFSDTHEPDAAGPVRPPAFYAATGFTAEHVERYADYFAEDDDGHLPGDLHRYFSLNVREFADRSHLVRKQIDTTRGRRWYWVNPNRAAQVAEQRGRSEAFKKEHEGRTPKEHLEHQREQAEPKRAEARAALEKARSDPSSLTPADSKALIAHMNTLTRDELRGHARAVEAKLGGLKRDLVGRLLESVGLPVGGELRAYEPGMLFSRRRREAAEKGAAVGEKIPKRKRASAAQDTVLNAVAPGPEVPPAPASPKPTNVATGLDTPTGVGNNTPVPTNPVGPAGGGTVDTNTKPGPFHYEGDAELGPLAGLKLEGGVRVNHPQAGDAIAFNQVLHNGKRITPVVRLAGNPKLQEAWAAHAKAHADHAVAEEAALHAAVPGLRELRAAREAEEDHGRAFDRMMEDGDDDGARPPAGPVGPAAKELAAKHPRAALYLRAEDYSLAADDRKGSAGRRAMELLRGGAGETEAAAVLENWLPESAWEN